jgi:hypothetical protein
MVCISGARRKVWASLMGTCLQLSAPNIPSYVNSVTFMLGLYIVEKLNKGYARMPFGISSNNVYTYDGYNWRERFIALCVTF